jgi:hypothetical protein
MNPLDGASVDVLGVGVSTGTDDGTKASLTFPGAPSGDPEYSAH